MSPQHLEFAPQELTVAQIQERHRALRSLEHELVQRVQDLCETFDTTHPDSDLTLIPTRDISQPIRWRWRHSRVTELPFYLLDADDKVRGIYLETDLIRSQLNYRLSALADEHDRLRKFSRSRQALEMAVSPQ